MVRINYDCIELDFKKYENSFMLLSKDDDHSSNLPRHLIEIVSIRTLLFNVNSCNNQKLNHDILNQCYCVTAKKRKKIKTHIMASTFLSAKYPHKTSKPKRFLIHKEYFSY